MPQNHFNKLSLTFSDEVIRNFLIFISEIYKKIKIQFQKRICSRLCQDTILLQKLAIYILLGSDKFHEHSKPVTLPFLTFYGCRSGFAKFTILLKCIKNFIDSRCFEIPLNCSYARSVQTISNEWTLPRKHKNIIIFYYLPFTLDEAGSSLYENIIRLCPLIDFFFSTLCTYKKNFVIYFPTYLFKIQNKTTIFCVIGYLIKWVPSI